MIKIIFTILIISACAYADNKSDAQTRANTLGTSLSGTYSDTGNIKNKLYNPVTSDTKMQTLNQSWKCADKSTPYESQSACNDSCSTPCTVYSFDAKLQCSSSTEAIIITPYSFSSGGEVSLKIQYDTDLDWSIDSSFTTSNISGFCSNGYVSCTPGTFNNCKYYEFGIKHKCGTTEYNTYRECDAACSGVCKPSDNKVLAFQRSVSEMKYSGGCFCSNSSCGSSFNGVFQNALSYFGGGITAHAMKELGFALIDTDIDSSTLSVKYYAANAASCLDSSDDKTDTLKSFYQVGSIHYDEELTEQMTDSESLYNTVTAQSNKTAKTSSCSVTNTPAAINSTPSQTLLITAGQVGNNYWCSSCSMHSITNEFTIADKNNVTEFKLTSVKFDDWIKITLNGYVVYVGPYGGDRLSIVDGHVQYSATGTGSCELGTSWSKSPNVDFKNYLVNGTNTLRTDVVVAGCGEGYAYFQGVEVGSDNLGVTRHNSCSIYEQDSNCRLYSETVNGTYETVVNYTSTGIIPGSTCTTVQGSSGTYVVCDYGDRIDQVSSKKNVPLLTGGTGVVTSNTPVTISSQNNGKDWFSIYRTYVCQDGSSYDFTEAKKQADLVGSTINRDTGDFNYYSDSGVSSGNAKIDTMSYDTCSYTCTVQTGSQDTTLFPDQTTRNTTTAVVKEQRPCGSEKICPYDSASETLISDCTCTNSFNEVISLFSSVNDAVHDMICSSTPN